jgi:hypothetical protein
LEKTESRVFDAPLSEKTESEESYNFEFKIEVKGESHTSPEQLVRDLLNTVEGDSGVFDLSKLRIEARKEEFREYLAEVLNHLYHFKSISFTKCMKLFRAIVNEYK